MSESFSQEMQRLYEEAQARETPESRTCNGCGDKQTLHESGRCYDCRGAEGKRDLRAKVSAGMKDDAQMLREMGLQAKYSGPKDDLSPYRFFYAGVVRQPCPDCGRLTATGFDRNDIERRPERCNECSSEALQDMAHEAKMGLGHAPEQEGNCSGCGDRTVVYGEGGRPLCSDCGVDAANEPEAVEALRMAGMLGSGGQVPELTRELEASPQADSGPQRRVMLTGSRGWKNPAPIWEKLDHLWEATGGNMTLIHGGAPGADSHGHNWAVERECAEEIVRPEWNRPDGSYNRAAGFERNTVMARSGIDFCVSANMGTNGTTQATGEAEKAGAVIEEVDATEATALPKVPR